MFRWMASRLRCAKQLIAQSHMLCMLMAVLGRLGFSYACLDFEFGCVDFSWSVWTSFFFVDNKRMVDLLSVVLSIPKTDGGISWRPTGLPGI